jgi:hypothetical protein
LNSILHFGNVPRPQASSIIWHEANVIMSLYISRSKGGRGEEIFAI